MRAHFSDEIWADYVRGLSGPEDASAIEQHLRDECQVCLRSFRLWQAFAEYAAGETRIDVPERNLRVSRAAFSEWFGRHSLPTRARMARLIFDSLLQPLPTGVRGGAPSPRRILAALGSWSVDLRLDSSSGQCVSLAGQILRSGKRGATLNAPVVLMSGDAVLAETSANEFGEFELQLDQTSGQRLYVEIAGSRPMGINLPDLTGGSTAGEASSG